MLPFALSMMLMVFQQWTGVNTVIFYTVTIFTAARVSVDEHLASNLVGLVQLLATASRKTKLFAKCNFGAKIQTFAFSHCLKITQNVAFQFWHFPPFLTASFRFSKTLHNGPFLAFLMNFCSLKM